jgi:hypothetical protein
MVISMLGEVNTRSRRDIGHKQKESVQQVNEALPRDIVEGSQQLVIQLF